jgi:hypothetical protein
LAVPIFVDADWTEELEELAEAFRADAVGLMTCQQRVFAAATLVDLQRIDRTIANLLNVELERILAASAASRAGARADLRAEPANPTIEYEAEAYIATALQLGKLTRYARRALARWRRAFSSLPD